MSIFAVQTYVLGPSLVRNLNSAELYSVHFRKMMAGNLIVSIGQILLRSVLRPTVSFAL